MASFNILALKVCIDLSFALYHMCPLHETLHAKTCGKHIRTANFRWMEQRYQQHSIDTQLLYLAPLQLAEKTEQLIPKQTKGRRHNIQTSCKLSSQCFWCPSLAFNRETQPHYQNVTSKTVSNAWWQGLESWGLITGVSQAALTWQKPPQHIHNLPEGGTPAR